MPNTHPEDAAAACRLLREGPGWSAEAGTGRTAVQLRLLPQGRDWLLLITGGQAHVGAVAAADTETCQLAVLPPHKEGPLAREAARKVARAAGCSCAVVAGIHQDNATGGEIERIVANVNLALDRLVQAAFAAATEE